MSSRPGTGTASAEPLGWAQLREAAAGAELAALLDSGERSALDDAQLVDAITASQRLVNVYASRQLAMAAELHRRRAAVPRSKTEVGATAQTVAELIPALYQSRYRLHQRLHLVEGLTTLPQVAGVFAAGRLQEYAVRCIVEEFATLAEARWLAADWQARYNNEHPHSALGMMPPSRFAASWQRIEEANGSINPELSQGVDR